MLLNRSSLSVLAGIIGTTSLLPTHAFATSFNHESGTLTSTQTLLSGETGAIHNGATISTNNSSGSVILQENASLTNDGTINSTGNTTSDVVGIFAGQNSGSVVNNIITNNGAITATNNGGSGQPIGIHLQNSHNSKVQNTGTITTNRTISGISIGIYLQYSDDSSVENTGSIISVSSASSASHGVLVTGSDDSTIKNSGIINITSNTNSSGMRITDNTSNTSIQNSGSISLNTNTGISHKGIRTDGNSNLTISNSGTITLSGSTDNIGISLENTDNTVVNNSGSITSSQAITFDSNSDNTTLNLLSGSKIVGSIELLGSNDTVNIKANSYSSNLLIQGAEHVNISGSALKIDEGSGNTRIITLGAINESSRSVALADLSSSIHSTIGQRLTRPNTLQPIQLASLVFSPELLFKERQPIFWSQFFGGKRENNSLINAYQQSHYGINLGYEKDRNSMRIGIVGGIANSTVDTEASTGTTTSYYTGLYSYHYFDRFNVSASIIGGIGDHDNKRTVINSASGTETAKSDFYSLFLSPSIAIYSAFTMDWLKQIEFRPSATLNSSLSYMQSYKETGTSATNFAFNNRVTTSFSGKLELAAAYQASPTVEVSSRFGMTLLETNEGSIKASLNGTSLTIDNTNDSNGVGYFIGLGMQTALYDNLNLNAALEIGTFAENESYTAGSLNAEYRF